MFLHVYYFKRYFAPLFTYIPYLRHNNVPGILINVSNGTPTLANFVGVAALAGKIESAMEFVVPVSRDDLLRRSGRDGYTVSQCLTVSELTSRIDGEEHKCERCEVPAPS